MSLRVFPGSPIPEETIRVAHAAFPKGNVCMQMHDALGPIYSDEQFGALFSQTGQPAEAPARLALVLVLQFAEGLSDRQAADAVRGRIDWKYALALELTDPGFDASVLSEFRTRLIHGEAEHLLLETLLTLLQERHLLKARGTQRTDSTHILAAIRTLNRLELVGETMRYTLNRLAVVAPAWLQAHMQPAWPERYGSRVENYRFPKADAARQRLAATIGADGFALLQAAYAPEAPPEVRAALAVEVLRQVWIQQYYGPDDPPRWRQAPDVPPAAQLIHSPYDVEARYSIKRGSAWVGYKAHATETCDEDTPHVITHVETTPATTPDDNMLETIHAALAEKALLPQDHLVDCGYTDADTFVASARDYGVTIVGPVAADPSWQAREGTGYENGAFTINWETHTATCPQGKQSRKWQPDWDVTGQEVIQIRFANKDCRACAVRPACTRAKTEPRTLTVRTQVYHEALQAARHRQTTAEFKEQYALRAGIEGTLSQGVRAFDLRRSRYIGLAKTHLQHILIAVAINVVRVVSWLTEPRLSKPYVAPFAALAAPA
jgi:transposase